jgi:MoaA/NifB/PqqE/SkfB family radical SAM enzyme
MITIKQIIKKLLTDSVVQIEPTRRCNFNCVHCTHKDNNGYISVDAFNKILKKHEKCSIVKLQGLGEPLLHPGIQELIDIAKNHDHKVMIITNGSCQYVNNVDFYVFSIETLNSDLFESIGKRHLSNVLQNVKYAASKQKVCINCVQCQSTSPNDVSDVKKFAKEIGADIWITPQEVWVDPLHPNYADQVKNTKIAWQRHGISPDYKKYRVCNWGVSEFYYDYTGTAHPCCIRMTDDYSNTKPSKDICCNCPL